MNPRSDFMHKWNYDKMSLSTTYSGNPPAPAARRAHSSQRKGCMSAWYFWNDNTEAGGEIEIVRRKRRSRLFWRRCCMLRTAPQFCFHPYIALHHIILNAPPEERIGDHRKLAVINTVIKTIDPTITIWSTILLWKKKQLKGGTSGRWDCP